MANLIEPLITFPPRYAGLIPSYPFVPNSLNASRSRFPPFCAPFQPFDLQTPNTPPPKKNTPTRDVS